MFSKILFDLKYRELNLVRGIFAVYAIGFLYGTKNHIEDIVHDGLLGYTYVPLPVNIYWTLLTLLDPLAIILLIFLPFWGLALSVWIMATDIAVNVSVTLYYYLQTGLLSNGRLCLQIAFGLFVFITAPIARKRIKGVQKFSLT
ncbi:MAG: hypothetical protein FJ117_17925 [Deltaproteobacteria bacterium]|nr:hypothetical protein [Deltaproteobacteria bacterium]